MQTQEALPEEILSLSDTQVLDQIADCKRVARPAAAKQHRRRVRLDQPFDALTILDRQINVGIPPLEAGDGALERDHLAHFECGRAMVGTDRRD